MFPWGELKAGVDRLTTSEGILLKERVGFILHVFFLVQDYVQCAFLVILDWGELFSVGRLFLLILLKDVVGGGVLAVTNVFVEVFDLLNQEKFVFLSEVIQGSECIVQVLIDWIVGFLLRTPARDLLLLRVTIIDKI